MKKLSLFMLMAVGLLISGNLRAEKTLVATMTALEQTTSFYMDEVADEPNHVYASAYDALTAALAALPDNSTPATVKLFEDVTVTYDANFFTVPEHHNVTIDLNNHKIYAETNGNGATKMILNYGTLTIEDKSTEKEGLISNCDFNADHNPIPGKGSYTILNHGTLTLNSGTIENTSPDASAGFAICDMISNNSYSPKFVMNGGTVRAKSSAIQIFEQSTKTETQTNVVEIKDGIVIGACGILIHVHGTSKYAKKIINISGGVFDVNGGSIISSYVMDQKTSSHNLAYTEINISNGTFKGSLALSKTYNTADPIGQEKLSISGGTFTCQPFLLAASGKKFERFITGGTFLNFSTSTTMPIEFNDNGWSSYHFKTNEYSRDAFQNYLTNCAVGEWGTDYWTIINPNAPKEKVEENEDYEILAYVEKSAYPDKEKLLATAQGANIIERDGEWIAQGNYDMGVSSYNKFHDNVDFFIAEGFTAIPYELGNPETDLIIAALRKDTIKVDGEKNLSDLDPTANDTTEITIVPNSGENAIVNITQDTKVNKIDVVAPDGKGEAQIVVKNGVTLDVGNGGVVSENDILTTILVETGGTLIIGTGGIDQEGAATPIEIQASEEKGSGVLIFSPNSKVEDTQKYAEVDLYTYCKQVNGKYYWQQFAIPVTGLANDKVVKTPNITSYVFAWDYSNYGWSQLSNWAELDEPFAGYDMTNISEAGGVVYTFKGDLIGNQNKQLTLPHKDYCVMGNSYTAPINIVALFEQIDKEMDQTGTGTIEKTVYKYDAKNHYYIYTTELEQELAKAGVMPASFTDIKPMEGFLLNLQSGNTAGVMLNYANAVYTPATTPAASLAPRMNSNTNIVVAKIGIQSAHAMDQMILVESDEFSADIENGKDAFKYLNDGANLYAFDGTNKLATVATDNLEGTMLAFQAAEDAEYTLTFDRALNTEYVLVDMMNGNEVAMTEGNTYTFFATPNTLDPARFMVKANAQAPTNMESTKATKVAKGIYTITGQYLGESDQWNAMPQGVYMVNGIKVIK